MFNMFNMYKRDYKTSKFKKVIGITIDDYMFIYNTKKKKTLAGKLEEIINFYKEYGNHIKNKNI